MHYLIIDSGNFYNYSSKVFFFKITIPHISKTHFIQTYFTKYFRKGDIPFNTCHANPVKVPELKKVSIKVPESKKYPN